jgi:hypothetical protein
MANRRWTQTDGPMYNPSKDRPAEGRILRQSRTVQSIHSDRGDWESKQGLPMDTTVPQSNGVAYKSKISNECVQILKNSIALYHYFW